MAWVTMIRNAMDESWNVSTWIAIGLTLVLVFAGFFLVNQWKQPTPPAVLPARQRTERAVLLYSNYATDHAQRDQTRSLQHVLSSWRLATDGVDGSAIEMKDMRDHLFAISGLRGKYPQCFIRDAYGYRFIGLWDEVERLVECDTLPAAFLASNPDIPTFSKVRLVHALVLMFMSDLLQVFDGVMRVS